MLECRLPRAGWGEEGRLRAALPPGPGRGVGPVQALPSGESRARGGRGGARQKGPRGRFSGLGAKTHGVSFQASDLAVLLACAGHTHSGLRTGHLLRSSVPVVFGLRSGDSGCREKCVMKRAPTLPDASLRRQREDRGPRGETGGQCGDPPGVPRGRRRAQALVGFFVLLMTSDPTETNEPVPRVIVSLPPPCVPTPCLAPLGTQNAHTCTRVSRRPRLSGKGSLLRRARSPC